jgi:glycosyltransferase involved in cell wall biosynthesis
MALGIPAVTSSIGLEGLGMTDGNELWVANSPEEFVERLIYIWDNPSLANDVALNARRYVEKNHTWDAMLNKLIMYVVDKAKKKQL